MSVRVGSQYPQMMNTPATSTGSGTRKLRNTGDLFNGKEVKIVEGVGERSRKNEALWNKVQEPYQNFATDKEVAERALGFVKENLSRFQQKTEALRRKWLTIEHLIKGNSTSRWSGLGAVQIPELYKMLETMVPRVEEALTAYDPWFNVFGREENDVDQAKRIQWFMEAQLDQAGFSDLIQPFIRSMLIYGFAALKIDWHRDWRKKVKKKGERIFNEETGQNEWTYTGKVEDVLLYEGFKMHLVDPFDFMIDQQCTRTCEARWIAHDSWKTWEEIAALGEAGVYKNWEQIKEQSPTRGGGSSDYYQQSRSLVWNDDKFNQEPAGSSIKYKVTEVHGLFDIYGEGRARECILTVVNEKVVVRVQENPDGRDMRPYAVARCVKEPWQFFGVGPFDHAVRLNMELDDHRNLALEAHRLSVNPLVFVDNTSEIPPSLYNIEPGSVFRVSDPRAIQFSKIPMSVGDAQAMTDALRRDIEESVGAPRIWEGTGGGGGTATEVERKIQEGNRRLRGVINSVSDAFRDMLRIMHSKNQTYVVQDQRFRVLGRKAKGLPIYDEVSPEDFQMDVDFEFQGVRGLKNMGLRTSQLVQFANLVAPALPLLEGQINITALYKDIYEALVDQRPSDEIIRELPAMEDLLTPEEEHMLFLQGQKVSVYPMDDDEAHMKSHKVFMAKDNLWNKMGEDQKSQFMIHVEQHLSQKKRKAMQKAAQGQMSPAFAGPRPPENGDGGNPEQELGGAPVKQQQQQQAPGQTAGETPGMQSRPAEQAVPGRMPQMFQTQNQEAQQ